MRRSRTVSGGEPIRSSKEALMSGGLIVLISAVFALQFLLWPSSAEAISHKNLQEAAKDAERAAECAKKGDTEKVKEIVSNTIKYAKNDKYKQDGLAKLVDDQDTRYAEKELRDFLTWKIGSHSA